MQAQEIEQIKNILANIEASQKKIPYLSDLEQHPVFWPIFSQLTAGEKQEVEEVIRSYILGKVESIQKTKGGQLFARFVESQSELFWKFREANDPSYQGKAFQSLGKEVEVEMFKLEGILTEKMLKQEKGLDKVVDSFYNIIYLFFPRYNEIE